MSRMPPIRCRDMSMQSVGAMVSALIEGVVVMIAMSVLPSR